MPCATRGTTSRGCARPSDGDLGGGLPPSQGWPPSSLLLGVAYCRGSAFGGRLPDRPAPLPDFADLSRIPKVGERVGAQPYEIGALPGRESAAVAVHAE